jgi:CrcB protein
VILAAVVGISGAVGAVGRYLADGAIEDRISGAFPWGTLVVNIVGSFMLGVLTGLLWYHCLPGNDRAVLGVGFCGGFTTWSTASWESVRLAESGLLRQALTFTLGGLAAALVVATAGIALAAVL